MASSTENHGRRHYSLSSIASNISFLKPPKPPTSNSNSNSNSATTTTSPSFKLIFPLLFSNSSHQPLSLPSSKSTQPDSVLSRQSSSPPSSPQAVRNVSSESAGPGFPSAVRISTLNSAGGKGGGGPAFVGQVFSMCDLSGTGLMAVSTHFDIPFISKRTPEWLKKMFALVTKSERNGPVFRFFMDLGDAVSYVKRLNIPSGVVGACRLDLAYEHFKEKPHLFQFVPNDRQVKIANKLLKVMPDDGGSKKVDGVPVFSSQNLDIAIATTDGIKWYTPYFFDKNMLDNILEESVDQHFHSLIQSRHWQRRRDVIDDNLSAEVIEESGDSIWEPPEVGEVLDEMGHPGIPLSVISKAAEIQLLYAVDRVLLGNRWLRKATGIQPKFPYMIDSFEKRTAASLLRASKSSGFLATSESINAGENLKHVGISDNESKDNVHTEHGHRKDFRFPFGDWLNPPKSKLLDKREYKREELQISPFLPKITMVGISTGEAGQMSKATLKKTMEDLTRELERTDQGMAKRIGGEFECEDRDPLFVANVGDYYSSVAKTGSARWVRRATN